MKLTDESAAFLRANGIKDVTKGVVVAGDMVAGSGTQIQKWLRFKPAAVVNPNMAAMIGLFMLQKAIESSLQKVTEYLGQIADDVAQLKTAQNNETLSRLDSIRWAIEEAESKKATTGRVSAVTWSKLQSNAQTLLELHNRAVREINSIAENLSGAGKKDKLLAEAYGNAASKDMPFWLVVLARTIELQDRFDLIEIYHVVDVFPDEVEDHRVGILNARDKRRIETEHALGLLRGLIRDWSARSDFQLALKRKVSDRILDHAAEIDRQILFLGEYTGMELGEPVLIERKTRGEALKGMTTGLLETGVEHVVEIKDAAVSGVKAAPSRGRELVASVKERSEVRSDRRKVTKAQQWLNSVNNSAQDDEHRLANVNKSAQDVELRLGSDASALNLVKVREVADEVSESEEV
ncbi:MAG: hypothetical protein Q4D87_03440 [Actinomycetaceae bacterium]|nr:hypothetical protein [Actinomycetaceae bacterium]